jgi:colanic acid/amylovoran biosynthesis glycosyltransferase
MKTILVYRDTLLPISETFIKAQAESMTRYAARYCGLWPAHPSLPLEREAALLNRDSGWMSSFRQKVYFLSHVATDFKARIKTWPVSLIHAHFGPDGVRAIPLAKSLRVPLIVTLHGYDITKLAWVSSEYRRLWMAADRILCVSQFVRQRALERGCPAEKLVVHYIGVDERRFAGNAKDSVLRPRNVLFVGRLVEKKGCSYLIDAMRQVQATVPTATVTIIGEGPLRASLERRARAANISCEFLGAQDSSAISKYMQDAAVFCVPSVTAKDGDSEGFGIVFIEAQAAGLPVVSFRHGGIAEAVHDGVTGMLAPERDSITLASYITSYLSDEQLRARTGSAGREFVRRHFVLAKQTATLERIYDDVLGEAIEARR